MRMTLLFSADALWGIICLHPLRFSMRTGRLYDALSPRNARATVIMAGSEDPAIMTAYLSNADQAVIHRRVRVCFDRRFVVVG